MVCRNEESFFFLCNPLPGNFMISRTCLSLCSIFNQDVWVFFFVIEKWSVCVCVCTRVFISWVFFFLFSKTWLLKMAKVWTFMSGISFHIILLRWEEVGFPGKERGWMRRPIKSFSQEGEAMEGSTAGLQSRDAHSPKGQKKGRSFGMRILSVDTL